MKPTIAAIITIALLLSVVALSLGSDSQGWQLDNNQSRVSFISTKAKDIAEVHRFTALTGQVSDSGAVTVAINLASVDTLIDIRNERVRNMLFDVGTFPEANITTQVDLGAINALRTGEQLTLEQPLLVNLHGQQATLPAELRISRLGRDEFQIATVQPLVVSANTFGLSDGVEMLRNVAKLPSISLAVPVSALVTFKK